MDGDPFADAGSGGGDARPLTIRGARPTLSTPIGGSSPALPAGMSSPSLPQPPADAAPAPAPTKSSGVSYDDATTPPTPHPGGVLSNSQDDGYLSRAAKGAATAAIKGVGDSVGAYGGMSGLADYIIARAESAYTGKPVDQVIAELRHSKDAARQAIVENLQRKDALRQATAEDRATVSRLLADRKASDTAASQAEAGLGVARMAVTAAGAHRALDGAVAHRAHQARAGRTVAMLDRIVLDDEAPLPGELPLLRAALDVLVVLFRIGEIR